MSATEMESPEATPAGYFIEFEPEDSVISPVDRLIANGFSGMNVSEVGKFDGKMVTKLRIRFLF